ncbi:MAG TPA: hypothetical protein VHE78_14280 [Gemmatimonadaceae bacterium]|nr:hypothetical protein [Gemmatimonadaceae bacterium]
MTTRFYAYVRELALAAQKDDVAIIVWELASGAEGQIESVAEAMHNRAEAAPILVRMDLTKAAARQVLVLARYLPEAQVSLRGHDDLESDINMLYNEPGGRGAYAAIVQRLLPLTHGRARDIVACASVAGHSRTSVRSLARLCGVPVRTLEWKLRAAQQAPAKILVGWMVALHSLWRLDVLGWTPKRTAHAARFHSGEAWSNYVGHHVGARPATLLREGGFESLLDQCARQVSADRAAGPL